MHMLICIIIFIVPCNLTFRPLPASACQCHLYVLCSPDACWLAWHLEPIVMKVMSVQVCSESTGHAEAVQKTYDPQQVGYGKLVDLLFSRHTSAASNRAGNDVGTQYRSGRGISHRRAAAGRTLCCRSSSCL